MLFIAFQNWLKFVFQVPIMVIKTYRNNMSYKHIGTITVGSGEKKKIAL